MAVRDADLATVSGPFALEWMKGLEFPSLPPKAAMESPRGHDLPLPPVCPRLRVVGAGDDNSSTSIVTGLYGMTLPGLQNLPIRPIVLCHEVALGSILAQRLRHQPRE